MRTMPRATKRRCARATSCSPTTAGPIRLARRAGSGDGRAWRGAGRGPRADRRGARRAARRRARRRFRARRASRSKAGTAATSPRLLSANRARDAARRAERPTARTARTSPSLTAPSTCRRRARSTGEQKALLLGLVLAHAELVAERRGAPPILLLDEVAAHLDPKRRAALFARLEGRGQVWMTATEAGAVRRHRRPPAVSMSRPGQLHPA